MYFDYLIIGAGVTGLAFADTLLCETPARIAIIDRYDRPGGAWNDAYAFKQLERSPHQFGARSFPISSFLSTQPDWRCGQPILRETVLAYFETLMKDHILATGRAKYFPATEHLRSGHIRSLETTRVKTLKFKRKIVDAARNRRWSRNTHVPCISFEKNVDVISPHALHYYVEDASECYNRYCIIGAGSAGADTAHYLLRLGVSADKIVWVKPREGWFIDPSLTGPPSGLDLVEQVDRASTQETLYASLETSGHLSRASKDIAPLMHHAAVKPAAAIDSLATIKHVVRKGHVKSISLIGLSLENGTEPMPPRTLYIDCTAGPVLSRARPAIFSDDQIIVQPCCIADASFSASVIAAIEFSRETAAAKNALCRPLARPDTPVDFMTGLQRSFANFYNWRANPSVGQWLARHYPTGTWAPTGAVLSASQQLQRMLECAPFCPSGQ